MGYPNYPPLEWKLHPLWKLNVRGWPLSQFFYTMENKLVSCVKSVFCDLRKPLFPRMKTSLRRSQAFAALFLAFFVAVQPLQAKTDLEQVAVSVGRLLEEGHYTRQPLNDEVSKKFLKTYLEVLDFSHLFFTQQDVDALTAKYATSLDDDVLLGNLKPAFAIYDLYQKRVDERVAKVKELLKQPMDFKTDATLELSRQKVPWPKDEAEADQLWRGRIANELLQENLSEHPIEPGPQMVTRRYDRLSRNVHEQDREE